MARRWTLDDARDLYNIPGWGLGLYDVGDNGNIVVRANGGELDLRALMDDLLEREVEAPVLVRLTDVLHARVTDLGKTFNEAIDRLEYNGKYRGVYPVKVNQQRHIVEEIVRCGRSFHLGLECGSKPELMIVLAELDDPEALIVCNGYKDTAYLEMALIGSRLGQRCCIVIEQMSELDHVLDIAERLDIEPMLGVRVRLDVMGTGRWRFSSGEKAKFGLSASEVVSVVRRLEKRGALNSLQLLHYHIGSQITAIRTIRDAAREASRFYVELTRLGAPMGFLDVGGGLGIDYDGSRTDFESSMNYTLGEYAETIIEAVQRVCDEGAVEHPNIVTETGRAMVAHSSVLVVPVTEVTQPVQAGNGSLSERFESIAELQEMLDEIATRDPQRLFHSVIAIRDRMLSRFDMDLASLEERAAVEALVRTICEKLHARLTRQGSLPEDMEDLARVDVDTFYCNFSLFQSLPDSWAIDQIFPVVPLQRLNERPTRRGVLADVTCDSDGRVDRFVDVRDVKRALELHDLDGSPYYLGIFLTGAYQEILGDLHNLFGDTNAVHVSIADTPRGYRVEHIIEGETVGEVLRYVQYDQRVLLNRLRKAVERAYDTGSLDMKVGKHLLRTYQQVLGEYTYLGDMGENGNGES